MRPPAVTAWRNAFIDARVAQQRPRGYAQFLFVHENVQGERLEDAVRSQDQLLQITPSGVITPIATNADGLLGAANMTLIHQGTSTVIYLANTGSPLFSTNTTGFGPALLKITIN